MISRPGDAEPQWLNILALFVWLAAGVVAFVPFAVNTSPWQAVTLRVPGDQGNWWHLLIGAPFFLAFPMVWLRLRALLSPRLSTPLGRRAIWIAVALSICGTMAVEAPFVLLRAGTSAWQRIEVIGLGFGIIVAGATILLLHRRVMPSTRACLVGLYTAYLANAALCLIVYATMPGPLSSRIGWWITLILVWPMIFELIWIVYQSRSVAPAQRGG